MINVELEIMKNILNNTFCQIYKILLISLILIGSFVVSSCEDLLTEEPRTFLSEENVFSSTDGILAANYGVYESLRDIWYYGRWLQIFLDQTSDVAFGRGSQVPNGNFQWNSVVFERQQGIWTSIYSSINKANIMIKKVQEFGGLDEELKNQLIGESRFIRALGYYHLVRLWGDVPLRLEPELTNFGIIRTSTSLVYDQIIEDLQFSESNLPDVYPLSENGRVTKWAAKSLLADVYLTTEQWSDAATKAKEVIDSELYSLVPVDISEDFNTKMFGNDVLTHSGDIFSLKYTVELNNSGWVRFFHRSGPGYAPGGPPYAIHGNLDSWIGQGEWATENSLDLRRNNSLYNGPDTTVLDDNIQMLFKKFRGNENYVSNSTPILRYAEILLVFAEAEAMSNNTATTEAYEAVNQVRRRAYGQTINVANATHDLAAGMSLSDFREAVIMERAKELLVEGKRWYDLLRTGTAIDVCNAAGFTAIEEKHLKWVIPQAELDNNDALSQSDQNPGW